MKPWAYRACSAAKLGSSRARRPHPAEITGIVPAPAFPSAIRDSRPLRRAEGVRKLPRICLKAWGPTMDETAARPHLERVHVRAGVLFEQLFGLTYQVFVRPGFQHVDGLNPLIADEVAAHPPTSQAGEAIARAKRSIGPVHNLTSLAANRRFGNSLKMKCAAELRATAANKRRLAVLARRASASLSLAANRVMLLQQAQELEAEAASLETEADALEHDKSAAERSE